ncbi:hypothetical protein DERP_011841 [Dermatophagoides pteronyssinus]|uniref:Uncharacterized protein n=1 Tax=Dermatophagoides pteronyssinus TaxID=6956 RepID=A0ABQ8JR86_DERPT|nr:hypothetical protein DERP_011841 [Dermatophagoides pteronyssinus]
MLKFIHSFTHQPPYFIVSFSIASIATRIKRERFLANVSNANCRTIYFIRPYFVIKSIAVGTISSYCAFIPHIIQALITSQFLTVDNS